MHRVIFRDWVFEADLKLTQKTYVMESSGSSDNCDCGYCQNFRQQKELAYPKEIGKLFENLGIDSQKEAEVCEIYERPDGLHMYYGQFHFAGRIISGEQCVVENSREIKLIQIDENFSIGFSENDKRFIEVRFETNLPWIMKEIS